MSDIAGAKNINRKAFVCNCIHIKWFTLLLFFLFVFYGELFSQTGTKSELIFAYDSKRDSLNGIANTVYLYFLSTDHKYFKVYEENNASDLFYYMCRYGSSSDEYFVFSLESTIAEGVKLVYWNRNSNELFISEVIGENLIPIETSFSSDSLSLTCISVDRNNCGVFIKKPVELIKRISEKDLIGNRLPPSLKIVQSWQF